MSKRPHGSGGLSRVNGEWVASVVLVSGRRVRRRRRTEEAAEAALVELLETFADELGYFYRGYPRIPRRRRPPRSGISPRVRFLVLQRDGFRCVYCGATAQDERLEVDHRLSIADGGTDDIANLATACRPCNAGKAGASASDTIRQDATASDI